MTGDVTTPSDLAPLKQPLVEAVINAYFRKATIFAEGDAAGDGSVIPLVESTGGSCDEGRFDFYFSLLNSDHPMASTGHRIYVSYPGGQWREDVPLWFDNDTSGPFDAAAAYGEIEDLVSRWIDPFVNGHSPHEFTNQIASIAAIIDQLYIQDEVRIGGNPVAPGDDEGTTSVPVSDIQTCVADIQTEIGDLSGLAIDALERSYTNDVGLTISGQRAMAIVAGLALTGEAAAWNKVYSDLRTFFTNATADFNSYAQSRGASGQGEVQTLSVISGVAAVASGATAAFPPASGTFGVISGVASIGAALWPQEEAIEPTEIVLGGGSYDEYWSSFTTSVRAVDAELTNAERCLATMCNRMLEDAASFPDAFSITNRKPDDSGQGNDYLDLQRFLDANRSSPDSELYAGTEINIVHAKLRNVAGMIETIGDHQRDVAGKLGGADSAGNPSALVESEWSRESLDGVVLGSGPHGHFASYEALVDSLVGLLVQEADTAHRVAEHAFDISTDFSLTDADREAELDAIAAQFDTV
ncbi:hypothetical protein [Nocardioides sp. 1609]|uniref:hypothetical protein n=1 Tax=Nocardioides sp. 1609 TaxID=2508327 RepID=UPI0010701627|nr:hypothetical protein [Nocardioides sp. 1609]